MFVAVVIALSVTLKKEEHYRRRVVELTHGKEGSSVMRVVPKLPPPPPPKKDECRPLIVEWLYTSSGEYFNKRYVAALTKNPNNTMNVVLRNGHTINTGLEIEDLKKVLCIGYSCSIEDERRRTTKIIKE